LVAIAPTEFSLVFLEFVFVYEFQSGLSLATHRNGEPDGWLAEFDLKENKTWQQLDQ
jgi:hypothetical protein